MVARDREVCERSGHSLSLRSIGHVLETEVNRRNEERHDREGRLGEWIHSFPHAHSSLSLSYASWRVFSRLLQRS